MILWIVKKNWILSTLNIQENTGKLIATAFRARLFLCNEWDSVENQICMWFYPCQYQLIFYYRVMLTIVQCLYHILVQSTSGTLSRSTMKHIVHYLEMGTLAWLYRDTVARWTKALVVIGECLSRQTCQVLNGLAVVTTVLLTQLRLRA